jgi:hypothetical protein
MFYVGQKVVFVGYPVPSTTTVEARRIDRTPFCEVGAVYTILGISERRRFATGKWAGPSFNLGFMDAVHGPVWHHHSGFRPATERKTDISALKALLNPSKHQVDA